MQNAEQAMMTVDAFARLLNVSNPYAANLIGTSAVAFGVMPGCRDRATAPNEAIDELTRVSQEMGLFDMAPADGHVASEAG